MLGALAGIAAVAAGATFAGLHSMVPWSQLYGANFNGAPPGTRTLALTYDDGPNDPYTANCSKSWTSTASRRLSFCSGSSSLNAPNWRAPSPKPDTPSAATATPTRT